MDRRPMTDGGAFREDHGDGSGVRHVRRRGHPPDGPRPRAAVLLLLPHLYGGLHRTGEGDPQAPMARLLQPRGRDPPLRGRLRAERRLVARRDGGTLEPRVLCPRHAGPVRRGMAFLPRHMGRIQEPQREHGRPDCPRHVRGLGLQRRRHVPPVPRGPARGQGDLLRHRCGDPRPHPPGEVLRGARAGPGRRCDPQADGPRAADRPRPAGGPRGRGARGARAGGRGRGRPARGTDSGRRHDR